MDEGSNFLESKVIRVLYSKEKSNGCSEGCLLMFYFDYFGSDEQRTTYPRLSPLAYALQVMGKRRVKKSKEVVSPEEPCSLAPLIDLGNISDQAQKILDHLNVQEVEHQGDFYMFSKPCENEFYRAGTSFQEKFALTKESRQALIEICEFYESKAVLKKKYDPFVGKPFLRYPSRLGGSAVYFYRKNQLYEQKV